MNSLQRLKRLEQGDRSAISQQDMKVRVCLINTDGTATVTEANKTYSINENELLKSSTDKVLVIDLANDLQGQS